MQCMCLCAVRQKVTDVSEVLVIFIIISLNPPCRNSHCRLNLKAQSVCYVAVLCMKTTFFRQSVRKIQPQADSDEIWYSIKFDRCVTPPRFVEIKVLSFFKFLSSTSHRTTNWQLIGNVYHFRSTICIRKKLLSFRDTEKLQQNFLLIEMQVLYARISNKDITFLCFTLSNAVRRPEFA